MSKTSGGVFGVGAEQAAGSPDSLVRALRLTFASMRQVLGPP